PARPADDDRYSSFPPFFWCKSSLAVTLFFVEHPFQPRERPRIMPHLRTRFWSDQLSWPLPSAADPEPTRAALADSRLVRCLTCQLSRRPSDTHAKAGHDHNDRDLHHALHCDRVKIPLHPSADLVQIRLDLLQFQADEHVDRGQEAKTLDRHQRDQNEGGRNPAVSRPV